MLRRIRDTGEPSRSRLKEYVVGLGLGGASAGYGLVALATGHTFLPGLKGGNATVGGTHAVALAVAYLAGGLYLICRFFVHARCKTKFARGQVYVAENLLLIVLIVALVDVLLKVGTAG